MMPTFVNPNTVGLRRSNRKPKPRNILNLASFYTFTKVFASEQDAQKKNEQISSDRVINGTINYLNPVHQVFAAKTDNETYNYKDMMDQEDYRDFIKAMSVEIDEHTNQKH